ncbi:MAG: hypothetical protein Q4A55_05970 [Aerococcus sp.]|nr:hypothetical protein [Aerococcus sp.]
MGRKRLLRYYLIGAVTSVLMVILFHWFKNPTFQGVLAPNALEASGFSPWISFFVGIFLFTWLSSAYEIVDQRLLGSKNTKAIFFSVLQGILIILYITEPLPHRLLADYSLNTIKIILLGVIQAFMLQGLLATERHHTGRRPFIYWRAVLVYAISFLIMRWVSYVLIGVYAEPETLLAVSYTWAALMGMTIGFVFCAIQRYLSKQQKTAKAFQFTLRFFAPLSVSYHVLFGLFYQLPWGDLVARCFLDILGVLIASFIVMQWQVNEYDDSMTEHRRHYHEDNAPC